jgi:hypothetical protein
MPAKRACFHLAVVFMAAKCFQNGLLPGLGPSKENWAGHKFYFSIFISWLGQCIIAWLFKTIKNESCFKN